MTALDDAPTEVDQRTEYLIENIRRAYALGYNIEPCRLWWNPARKNGAGGKDVAGPRKNWQTLGRLEPAEMERRIRAGEANGYLVHCSTSVPQAGGCTLLDGDTAQECERIAAAVAGAAPHVRSGTGWWHWYARGLVRSSVALKTKDTAFGPGTWYVGPDGAVRQYTGALPEPTALLEVSLPVDHIQSQQVNQSPGFELEFWQTPKTTESAGRQWRRLHDRMVGFVRRCEMFGWGSAHEQLLELTRELAQLSPEHAHRAVGEWFREGGAGFVDNRVWAMLDSAMGKYPSDKIVAPTASGHGATNGSPVGVLPGGSPGQHQRQDPQAVGPAVMDGSTPAPLVGLRDGPSAGVPALVREEHDEDTPPRRLPMIGDTVWEAYGWTRSVRAQARAADVCPDAVLGAVLATYAARVPPGVRIVTGTKMPLGTNLVVSLVGPSGSDKSTAFTLAQKVMPGSAVPVIANPGSGEAFAASFVHADPDGEGAVSKRAKVLKPDPRALFYVAEGALVGSVGSRLGSTWLPHLRSLAVDESLSTTNATSEINRQVPAQSYSAGVVVGFQVTTATTILHDTGTGTAQRFLWFTSLSTEDLPPGAGTDAAHVPMAVPVLTRLGTGIDEENRPINYLVVAQTITERIRAEQRHYRLTRDITSSDDHDAHRHTLVAKLAALATMADDRVLIEERDWAWAEALYAASAAVRDELLLIAEQADRDREDESASRMGRADRTRKQYDSAEARVAETILRRVDKIGGRAKRRDLDRAVSSRDKHLLGPALEQLEKHGYLRYRDGVWSRVGQHAG